WAERVIGYQTFSRGLARQIVHTRRAGRTFWHLSFSRKILIVMATWFFVIMPLSYVVPRPHYVEVTDDNAVHYLEDGHTVMYLIHAVDLFNRSQTREYMNEDA